MQLKSAPYDFAKKAESLAQIKKPA